MKRSFSDVDNDAESQPRPARANGFNPKRQKQYGTGKHKAKEGSLEYSRKRARNIERLLLRKKDLPANVQNDLQRELESHKSTLSDKSFLKRRSAMISKYHMVRFFERKKASRLAKQIKRKIEQNPGTDDADDLKRQLHIAEVDEAYTIYHPHMEPYVSLYGNSKSEGNDKGEEDAAEDDSETKQTPAAAKAALKAKRPPMWSVVEKAMEEGLEALKQLRERRSADDSAHSAPATKKHSPTTRISSNKPDSRQQHEQAHDQQNRAGAKDKASKQQKGEQPQLNRRERRRLMREAMASTKPDEDDDGGFFEGV